MAGIYGNHPEDRYFERQLHKYLDEMYGEDDEEVEPDEESEDEDEDS